MATEQEPQKKKPLTRRRFLQVGAIVLGGAVVAVYPGRVPMRRFAAHQSETTDLPSLISSYQPDFWFEVLPDNTILIKSPKSEMGQGIFTGFALLAAEELEVPLQNIKVEHASTARLVDTLGTGGSNTTSSLYTPIREVAATMREMLKTAAAKQWGVDVSAVTVRDGVLTAGGKTMTYAQVAQSTTEWDIPKTPPLKPRSAFKHVGKNVPRVDLKPKVLGEPIFGIDQTMPEMLHAIVLESPSIGGTIKSVNLNKADQMPGVVRVVQQDGWVAVVAKKRYSAEMAARTIEITWNVPKQWQQADIEAIVTVGKGTEVSVQSDGDAASIFDPQNVERQKAKVFTQEYRTPLGAHAQMEPNGVIAHVEQGKATLIVGTQAPSMLRDAVASALDMSKEAVEIRIPFLGGGFGRKYRLINAVQAALLSKSVGKPVSLFNTREQEFQNSYYRPNTHHVLKAVVSANGSIEAIAHDHATPDMVVKSYAGDAGLTLFGADFIAAAHGAGILYSSIPHKSATVWHNDLPFETGIWRSVGIFSTAFAIESFINEVAHDIGKDPLALRLSLVAGSEKINERYKKVLETLADKSGWNTPKTTGIGRGVALANDRKTIAAAAVEVAVVENVIQVKKVTLVMDVGVAVNPEGIRMQMEGCVMMGLSATLYEGLQVKDGQIGAANFHEYPLATLNDTPEIHTFILENDDQPYGVGEPPIGPIAPAIAEAVFDATGKRLRSLPLRLS